MRKYGSTGIHGNTLLGIEEGTFFDGVQYFGQFITEEYGNDSGRCFVCTESVVVSCTCYGKTKQIGILINSLDNGG